MSKQVIFFATRADLIEAVKPLEASRSLKYIRCMMSDDRCYEAYPSLNDIDGLGMAAADSYITGTAYLVLDRRVEPEIESVPQRKGSIKFIIDQHLNPCSIIIRPGGIYKEGLLICGNVGTASKANESLALYREYSRRITKSFKKLKAYYVGRDAYQLLKAGWRLITMHTKEDPGYDLTEC